MKKNVTAIIITYFPQMEFLLKNIKTLLCTANVVVVDNTPGKDFTSHFKEFSLENNVSFNYIALKYNSGIAQAQNIGLIEAIKGGADYFLMLDQDSSVTEDFVSNLISEYFRATKSFTPIAAIGPTIINQRNETKYLREINKSKKKSLGIHDVDVLISSGTLIPAWVLSEIGMNNSSWFIDLVDFEWCFRAKKLGYHILMTSNVTLKHQVGLKDKKLWRGKYTSICSPFRLYYVFRNCIFTLKSPYFPMRFKIRVAFSIPVKIFIQMTCDNKTKRIIYITRGILDGFINRLGSYEKNWERNKKDVS